MASVFSKIVNGEIPCYKIAENEAFLAFLDITPQRKGHTLVIPKKETDYIFDIDDQQLAEFIQFAKVVANKIKAAIP
jgi:histidine triad (HIT) family protein